MTEYLTALPNVSASIMIFLPSSTFREISLAPLLSFSVDAHILYSEL